jgi:hypothetical protein
MEAKRNLRLSIALCGSSGTTVLMLRVFQARAGYKSFKKRNEAIDGEQPARESASLS